MAKQGKTKDTNEYDLRAIHTPEISGWYVQLTWSAQGKPQITITANGKLLVNTVALVQNEMINAQRGLTENRPLTLPSMGDFEIEYHTLD